MSVFADLPRAEETQTAAIWWAITEVRKHELQRLIAENASMRAQIALANYEKAHSAQASPAQKVFTSEAWRHRPRRQYHEPVGAAA